MFVRYEQEKDDGQFKIINGANFLKPNFNSDGPLPPSDVWHIDTLEEVKDLIERSQPYFKEIMDGTTSITDKNVYIYSNEVFPRISCKIYYTGKEAVSAYYTYIKHKIVVKMAENGMCQFTGVYGKAIFEVARICKLDLLVYLIG